MLSPLDTLGHLTARLGEAAAGLDMSRGADFLSLVLDLPCSPAGVPQVGGPQFHFLHTHRDELRSGYGVAGEWHASGPDRLLMLRAKAQRLSASWRHSDPDETGFTGFALLGFAARAEIDGGSTRTGLPNALLWLPEIALCSRRGQSALVLSTRLPRGRTELRRRWTALLEELVPALLQPIPSPLTPAYLTRCRETPTLGDWKGLVQDALDQIAATTFEKVVVGRRLRIEGSRRFNLRRLLGALGYFFPSCQIVNVQRGAKSFVAATPERLLTLRGTRVEVDALAGTTARASEAQHDGALAEALRCSPKNRHEHRLVVQAIRDALASCASRIHSAEEPAILQLNNAQHLWTRISATLDSPSDVFALADALHPTPATNGQPRCRASAWLQRSESFERGWYTGAAGLVEPDLTGELWVLLRCAEISDRTAELYAGAGIVEGSDPASEWRETEQKLAAMLTALQFA
jgi:menaquinone-specific isochorismate synthase